ncbi:MAG: protein kinase [Polyangiales bacterium]
MHEHPLPGQVLRAAYRAPRARHPNLVDLEPVRRDGALVFVIEPHGGESLRALIAQRTSGVVLLRHLLGAMRGAAALHRHGVIHGDIRPENIFLGPREGRAEATPKLLHRPGVRDVRRDRAYRAPEQRAGWLLDARTDVYGFGVVLHEVLTGRLPADLYAPPRAGAHGHALLALGADADHVPAGLARLVRAALQPDPALRPNSVEALMAAVEPYTRCPSLRGALPPRPRVLEAPLSRHPQRTRLGVAVAAAFAVLGALGTLVARPELATRISAALAESALTHQVRSGIVSAAGVLPEALPSFAARAREGDATADLARE